MSKLLTIKTARLRKAIDNYFFTKYIQYGMFKNEEQKTPIINEICKAAEKEGKGCEIVPGCIVLKTKTKHIWIVSDSTAGWIIKENLR